MVDTYPNIFVKTHRMYSTESKATANYKLWVVIMCQCSFISCTSLMQATDIGEVVSGWRQEV